MRHADERRCRSKAAEMERNMKKRALSYLIVAALAGMLALCVGCSSSSASSSAASASASGSSAAASTQSSEAASSSAASIDPANLADGDYQIEVTLTGGSGKATVESPAKLVVDGRKMTAVIVWSSPNYDQMIVDGEQYLPVPRAGNSTFQIPVKAFDEDLPIQAETTAMSQPHMIDYTLRFDSSTIQQSA